MTHPEVERAQGELRRGRQDPDAFFAERGFTLACRQVRDRWLADLWWADLGLATRLNKERHQPYKGYGVGSSELDAKVSAVERWMLEEEHPDLRRQEGDPLP